MLSLIVTRNRCEHFHNDRLRNLKALGNRKSNNKKMNNNKDNVRSAESLDVDSDGHQKCKKNVLKQQKNTAQKNMFLYPHTGLQVLRTFFLFMLLSVLRLFHFTTDRRQTSHTHG